MLWGAQAPEVHCVPAHPWPERPTTIVSHKVTVIHTKNDSHISFNWVQCKRLASFYPFELLLCVVATC